MKGKILDFNQVDRKGVIAGDDGKRYTLDLEQWNGSALPQKGAKVDFSVNEDQAQDVYAESHTSLGSSNKIAAALFAFFLGCFGAHKFYLGYTKQGVIMLLVFLFGFILLGLPSLVIGIIALVEFIMYLTKSDDEFNEIYVNGKKAWF